MKSSSSRVAAPARICAIFPGALGDFICFLPTLQVLRQGGLVDLYARSEFSDLVPDGVTVRSLELPEIGELFRLEPSSPNEFHRFHQYATVFSWHGSGNQQFAQRLHSVTNGRACCFAFRPSRAQGHQADYYLECVNSGAAGSLATIPLRPEACQWRKSFWIKHALDGVPVLVIAPGSGAREKNWPAEFFFEVVLWWRKAAGGKVLLLIGPVERERGGFDELRRRCIIAEDLTLAQIAAALTESIVYLGNDSGISHLAGALGTRTVALFGPSNPFQWVPRGDKVLVLRRNLPCSPCDEATMKACPHHGCLRGFSAQEVIAVIARLPEVILTR